MATIADILKQRKKSVLWLSREIGMPYTNLSESIAGRRLWRGDELDRVLAALELSRGELDDA